MADINVKLLQGTEAKMAGASAPAIQNGQLYFATIDEGTKGYIYLDSNGKRFSFGKYAETAGYATEAGAAEQANKAVTANSAKNGIYYIEGSGSTAGAWIGSHPDITEYYNGLTIAFKTDADGGASATTLKINNLAAVTVVRNATTAVKTTNYPNKSIVILTYTVDGTKAYWKTGDYDANSYAYARQYLTSSDISYPLLFRYDVSVPTNSANYVTQYTRYADDITINPYTGTIKATQFSGNASSATIADSAGKFSTDGKIEITGDAEGSATGKHDWTIDLNVKQADKWSAEQDFVIKDADGINAGSVSKVDGSKAITLKLPSTIKATLNGNADTTTKLKNARKIKLTQGATGAIRDGSGTEIGFDGSADVNIRVDDIKESYLSWGGKNHSGTYGPIDAAMVPQLGANRLAFMPANAITIEYSQNGGSTWSTYNVDDATKINLFNGKGTTLYIGASSATKIDKSQYMLRVTINTSAANVYTVLNKFVIYVSSAGSSNCYCSIDARLQSNYTSNTNTWKPFASNVPISGWSGWNVINTSGLTTFGNTATSQYGQVRFTFGVESHASSVTYPGLTVFQIMGFGGMGWTTPSNMAKNGYIYSYDHQQNVTFPKEVTASIFNGTLNGTANKANVASLAEKLSVPRLGADILTTAIAQAENTETMYFAGSDGVSTVGLPSTYCFVSIKKGSGGRTLIDCYKLDTGEHWINSTMNAAATPVTWTGWQDLSVKEAESADHWSNPATFRITDGTNYGAGVAVDGSSAVDLPLPNIIKATLNGNADSATQAGKLTTARKFTIGNTGKDFNGESALTWTPSEIGYRYEWQATIHGQVWSRLCYIENHTPTGMSALLGNSFILNIAATRGSVVYNDTFLIKTNHQGAAATRGKIIKISGSEYSTGYSLRLITNTNGVCYVEIKDNLNSIANGTSQGVVCRLIPFYTGKITTYTTFTSGATLPSGFEVTQEMTTTSTDIQANVEGNFKGNLDGNATSATTASSAAKVNHTLSNNTKYSLSGTTLTASGSSDIIFDTGIYTDTTPGHLVVTGGIDNTGDLKQASGHLYLTGAQPTSSTGNETQIVFGTPSDQHVVLSSNRKLLVINPTTNSTGNQILFYLDQASKIPSGLQVGSAITPITSGQTSLGTADLKFSSLHLSGDANIGGGANVGGNLTVTNNANINKILTVKDNAIINSNTKTPYNFTTNLYNVNKKLTWNTSSYIQHVILLIPVLTSTNWSGYNYIEGKFLCWKTGGNVYDTVEISLNCVYNNLRYHLESFGDHANQWKLCICNYNGIAYYALNCPYHANPYTNVEFIGHVKSVLPGGTNPTSGTAVELPLDIPYYNESTATVLNNEVKTSITDTLTTSIVTSASNTKLYSIGGFQGNLTGNVSGNLTGNATITNYINPQTTGVVSLGNANYKFSDLHLSGNANIGTNANISGSLTVNQKAEIKNTLVLSKAQDASGVANNEPALIVGGTATTAHIEIDNNEILAKSDGTTPATLNLNTDGGATNMGGAASINGKLTLAGNIAYTNVNGSTNYADYDMIKFIPGTGDGAGMVIGGGGAVIIGSGESATAYQGTSGANIAGNSETMAITADGAINFVTNCQTIGNRAQVNLDVSRQFYPVVAIPSGETTAAAGSLGTNTQLWNKAYIKSIYATELFQQDGAAKVVDTITGGTVNTIPKFSDANTIENSKLTDDGTTLTYDGKGSFKGLKSTLGNEFICSGNEFNFIPSNQSGSVYINYETSSRDHTGNVTEYRFCAGNAATGDSKASLRAWGLTLLDNASIGGTLTVTGATSLSTLSTSGNTTIGGEATVSGNLNVKNKAVIEKGLEVTGDASIVNLLTVGHDATHRGIKVGNTYINAIDNRLIFQNVGEIRFGADAWDYNQWAGLKYDSSNKLIYLGLADNTIFTANSAQLNGRILTPGIKYFNVGNQTAYTIADGSTTSQWVHACNGESFINSHRSPGDFSPMLSGATTNGRMTVAFYNNALQATYITKANCDANNNTTAATAKIFDESGGGYWPGSISVGTDVNVSGSLVVNQLSTLKGNTTIGDADTDTLTVNATATFGPKATFNKGIFISKKTGIEMEYTSSGFDVWMYPKGADTYGIRYFEGTPDKMAISASGNNQTVAGADLCINGNGDGTITMRGKNIPHTNNTTGTVGSTSKPVYVNAGAISEVTGIETSVGGTGSTSYTANRMIRSNGSANALISTNHYTNETQFAVNSTTIDNTLKFYVNGNSKITGNLEVTGTSTFTGLITANGGVKGNLTGNVTGNLTGNVTGNLTGTADLAKVVIGSYTANGGQQNPNYFGKNKVGFLMMNTPVNGNSQYKDWMIMDCYSGSDVGGAVAIGVNRQSLGAYIMRSAAERTSWAESAELLHTANYTGILNSSYVTLSTDQTITGDKTFEAPIRLTNAAMMQYNEADECIEFIFN